MPFPENFNPEDYVAFALEKLVRTGIATDTWQRGGHLQAILLEGAPLLPKLAAKMLEELTEVGKALQTGKRAEIIEEMVDMLEAIQLGRRSFGWENANPPYMRPVFSLSLLISQLRQDLKGLAATPESWYQQWLVGGMYHQKFLMEVFTANVVVQRLALAQNLKPAELQEAFDAKQKQKGPLEGLYLKTILLPKNDDMVPRFAEKARAINVAEFNWNEVLTPAHLLKAG